MNLVPYSVLILVNIICSYWKSLDWYIERKKEVKNEKKDGK